MSLPEHIRRGLRGEQLTARFLRDHGYEIVGANFLTKVGETDIIALKDKTLCFVEVKTRRVGSMTQPYEAVTLQKQQRLIRAAQIYLAESKTDRPCRFDVCEVIVCPDTLKPADVNYIENAFEA